MGGLEAGVSYAEAEYVTAGYDSPMVPGSQRHNEVWVEILPAFVSKLTGGQMIDVTDPSQAQYQSERQQEAMNKMTTEDRAATESSSAGSAASLGILLIALQVFASL